MEKNGISLPYGHDAFNTLLTLTNNAEVGLYVVDFDTCETLFANRKMAFYAGELDAGNMIGKTCWESSIPEDNKNCPSCPYKNILDKNGKPSSEPYVREMYLSHLKIWLKVVNQAIYWSDGRLVNFATYYDITDAKKWQKQLVNLVFMDALLGLRNESSLEHDVRLAEDKPSLVLLDILSMQKINDVYGRETGDHLLRSMRDWLVDLNVPNSQLYRIGGDSFCLTVGDIAQTDLKALADTVSHRFTAPWVFEFKHDDSRIRLSCGASVAVIHGSYIHDDEPLLNVIERTLNTAELRKRVVVYDKKMDSDYKNHIQLEISLKKCVQDNMNGFDVHYQAIADPATGIWCGLEALCRWQSPDLDSVSPVLFIPEAERLGLISIIGLWVLDTAICKCKAWGLDKHNDFVLDVNVSPMQFLDENLADKVIKILQTYDYPSKCLCLEITESTQFTFTDQSLETIEQLRAYGILVALDDFGTGYSNFNTLKSLPVDIVKIERVFVTSIESDEYNQYLFRIMVELAHTANMRLIAEGVEREGQVDILAKSGADCLQGYLFSKPLPPKVLETYLSRFGQDKVFTGN